MRLLKGTAPVLAAAVVVATVVGVTWSVRDGGAAPTRPAAAPPVLHLVGLGRPGEPTDLVMGIRPGGRYRLVGPLPSGPRDATAYRLAGGPVAQADVLDLARALGLTTDPERVDSGWIVAAGVDRLVVSDASGHGWAYGPTACVGAPSTGADGGAGCAISGPPLRVCGVGRCPAPPLPDGTVVARRLASLLAELGGEWSAVTVNGDTASAQPIVDGRRTSGRSTWLSVTLRGGLRQASGHLGRPIALASYPLVAARTAFDRLADRPMPLAEVCQLGPDRRGCLPPRPVLVTGATLGLAFERDVTKGALLVPAWLFQVRGQTEPIVEVAVEPRYLGAAG